MKNTSYLPVALVTGALFLLAFVFVKSNAVAVNVSNEAAVINSIQSASSQKQTYFSVELSIPGYQPAYLRHPQKFFSGRELKIVKNEASKQKAVPISEVTLSKVTKGSSGLQKTQPVKLVTKMNNRRFPIVTIPKETSTGSYAIDFFDGSQKISISIEIDGSVDTTLSKSRPVASRLFDSKIISVSRLGCGYCFWELSSAINPIDENYGYFSGGGGSDYLVSTNNAWTSSTINYIDKITSSFSSQYRYRGDPYLTFDADSKLSLVSLLSNWGEGSSNGLEMITGGIYKEVTSKSNPPKLSQIIVKPAPPVVPPGTWIVFDYPKLSVDTSSTSPYKGNMYVFANGVLAEDGIHGGQGRYVITSSGSIKETMANYAAAITATAVGPGGEVYGVKPGGYEFNDGIAPREGHYIIRSLDGGKTFSRIFVAPFASQIWCPSRLSTQSQRSAPSYRGPDIAVDKNSGRVYVAWSDPVVCLPDNNFEYSHFGFDFNVYASYSDDRGGTWSAPILVNDDTSGGDQTFPSIDVGRDGNVYVAFIDHRDNQDKSQFDVYLSKSNNGGRSFSENLQVNDISVPNASGGARSIGDYLRMVSVGEKNIYVAHPCVAEGSTGDHPSDGCVSVVSKSTWNPPMRPLPASSCERFLPGVIASGYNATLVQRNGSSNISLRVSNNDYQGCGPSNFSATVTLPPLWQLLTEPNSSFENIVLLPGAWGYMEGNFIVSSDTVPGSYMISIEITNKISGLKKSISVPVQVIPPISVESLDPEYGPVGTVVTITGTSFSPNNNQVIMGGLKGWADLQQLPSVDQRISYIIPAEITLCNQTCERIPTPDGDYTITVDTNNSSASAEFHVGNASSVQPTALVLDPSIKLTYGSNREESLVTIFKVKIDAGSEDQMVVNSRAFNSYLKSSDNKTIGGDQTYTVSGDFKSEGEFYIIEEGNTAIFTVTTVFNPKKMFAGSYYGVIDTVRFGDSQNPLFFTIPTPNTTKPVTIIGEVSPYINSVSHKSIPADQEVILEGVRFALTGNVLTLTNNKSGGEIKMTLKSVNIGKEIQFVPNVPEGDYSIQVKHPVTGSSNIVYLQVTASPTVDTVAPSVPKNAVANVDGGNNIRFSWNASTDTGGSGLAGYKVYRDNYLRETTTSLSAYDDALPLDTTFCWSVAAYDNSGNISARTSDSCETTTSSSVPPPPPPAPTPVPPPPVVNLLTSFSQGTSYSYDILTTSGSSITGAVESTGNIGGSASNRLTLDTTKQYKLTYTLTKNSGTSPNIRFVSNGDGRGYIHTNANGGRTLDHTAQVGTQTVTFSPSVATGHIEVSVGNGSKTDFTITDVSLVEAGPSAQINSNFLANIFEVIQRWLGR